MKLTTKDEEIWKDVVGYEGLYQVSNMGRFASFYNRGNHKADSIRRIKPVHKRKNGYYVAILTLDGKSKYAYIHRLVADAFCPKRFFCNEVDHIDCDKQNNKASNLRWVTSKENHNNPITQKKHTELSSKHGRKIAQCTIDGKIIRSFNSIREVEREMPNISRSRISKCAKGEIKIVNGFIWKFL